MNAEKTGLLQIIDQQKKQIERYKTKLADIATAYKTLSKDKEVLEQSLAVIQSQSVKVDGGNETEDAKQIAALVANFNTVTAAKAKMEASFQADKKQLREIKETIERERDELAEKVARLEVEAEEWKSKLIVERHDRDKEQADHGMIMKELQNLLADERRKNVDESFNTERRKSQVEIINMEKVKQRMVKLQNELEMTTRKLALAEKKSNEPPLELFKLQDEIRSLQIEHQTAIEQERQRAEFVEERAKKNALVQEERVVNLETRLAELSAIVGTYDRLRQQDQNEIIKLKEYIAAFCFVAENRKHDVESGGDVAEEEVKMKQEHSGTLGCDKDVHVGCMEDLENVRRELEACKLEMKQKNENVGKVPNVEKLVKHLQDRIRGLTDEANIREKQIGQETEKWKQLLKAEKTRAKETLAATEADFRGRLNLLETQFKKLRERSMQMLEDKEQEIHSLQGTFQAFLPGARTKEQTELPALTSMRDGPRMLHYANELARRDVDISNLRKSKHKLEVGLRDIQRAAASNAETHREERESLREEISRLNRCQSRDGANLEYLKNVVLSFLVTNDPCSKRRIVNAITAVLKFSEEEQEKICKHNNWYKS